MVLVFGAARLSRAHLLKRIAAAGLTAALAVTVASLGGPAAADPATSRNLALNRAVVHSAAKNYGETGHRATDGLYTVVDPADPRTEPNYSAIDGVAENAFDGDVSTVWSTTTIPGWIDVDLPATQTVTSYQVNANVLDFFGFVWPMNYPVAWDLKGSVDGVSYAVVDSQADQSAWTTTGTVYTIATPGAYQYYRLDVSVAAPPFWGPAVLDIAELQLFGAGGETFIPPAKEQVKWSAPASAAQSITVDLGVPSDFSHITCQWEAKNYATEYSIDVSANGSSWTTVYSTTAGDGYTDEIALPTPATGQRYVRLDVTASSGTEYALQEIEVWGDNDLSYELPAVPVASPDGTQYLSGGNWRLARASEVALGGADLSSEAGAAASAQWVPATVPGTALTSYLNAGAIVDPDFSDNQLQISDTFFTADWWYTNHFPIPVDNKSKRTWLNFDAINWKANVYFNGTRLGPRQGVSPSRYDIEGAYTPAQFEVTDLVNYGGENYLAVFIKKNDTPGAVTQQDLVNAGGNGGALGADNPTIHASIGWDWVPTIRGRDIGIYESVFLSYSGDVRIENPWVITDLDLESGDLSSASLTIKTELRNPTANGQNVVVSGVLKSPVDARGDAIVGIDPIPFTSTSLYVPPRSTAEVLVDAINVADPQLWWPNGYGDQPLYTVELTARTAPNVVADKASFKTGIREYSYATVPDSLGAGLNVSINGVRVVARGGNWGMSDANMAATAEDFDLKMRLHADENFNMVRNWVGMTGHPAFYDAADKYGIMIWDDFWLANPVDGPNPTDEAMFEASAIAKIKRVRSHAALALYCGRNEGSPPATIDAYLRTWTRELDGTRTYVSDSASSEEGTGGHGPYGVRDPSWYYINTPAWNGYNSSANGAKNLSSERGQLNIPTLESMRRMLGENIPWPPNDLWGLHDFTTGGATEAGVSLAHIENTYDPDYVAHGVEEYVATAQLMNYDNHKGMFEPVYVNDTPGLLMWMSQSAWPSMAWQTYDYYYDLNAGYYGTKKANQPINAIYNVTDEQVYLSNETVDRLPNATVTVEVWGLDGAKKSTQSVTVDAAIGAQDPVLTVSRPEGLAGERFIRTSVADATGAVLGTNFYWTNPDVVSVWPEGSKTNRGTNTPTTWADHKALRDTLKGTSAAPVAPVNLDIEAWPQAGAEPGWEGVGVRLSNPTDRPALLARVKGIDEDGAQILPFIMDDNYVTLMPGETITLSAQYQVSGRQGDLTRIGIDGYNVAAATADLGSSPAGLTDSLSRLVAAAEILPQGITSDATWAAFTGALAEARGVLALASPSQLAVDQAASALRWAIAGLELPAPADVRRLAAAVATARNLNATQYDPASWGAVAAAIMAAEAVLSQPYPVQDAADAAGVALASAVAQLAPPSADGVATKAALDAVVAMVRSLALDAQAYTAASWTPYAQALAAAQAVLADPGASPTQLASAQARLTEAFTALDAVEPPAAQGPPPGVALLGALIQSTSLRAAAGFTAESWAAFQAARTAADAVWRDSAATEAQVAGAITALLRAENLLVATPAPSESDAVRRELAATEARLAGAIAALVRAGQTPVAAPAPGDTTVTPSLTPLAKVKAAQRTIRLVKGKSVTIPALGYAADGVTSTAVRWTSSDTTVVKVNRATGKIRALKAGKATVKATATTKDAKGAYAQASIKVTVVAAGKATAVSKVTAAMPKTLKVGATEALTAKVTPLSATGAKVSYASSKGSVATVDKAGTLRGIAPGTATITLKAGGKSARYKVTVTQ